MEQNFKNHSRFVIGYHVVLAFFLLAGLIGSIRYLIESIELDENLYPASLLTLLFVCGILLFMFVRSFPLKAQDRAIRAEENFRHFLLTGKILPENLAINQIVALRFASNEEFPALTERAATENLSNKKIKQAIKNWKPDVYRV